MTDLQTSFVREYLVDLNATAAAGRAGYSDPSYGRQLLTNPNVRQSIDQALVQRAKKSAVTAEMVLERIWHEATTADSDSARVRALELYGKHLGVTFTDDHRHTVTHHRPVEELTDDELDALLNEPP